MRRFNIWLGVILTSIAFSSAASAFEEWIDTKVDWPYATSIGRYQHNAKNLKEIKAIPATATSLSLSIGRDTLKESNKMLDALSHLSALETLQIRSNGAKGIKYSKLSALKSLKALRLFGGSWVRDPHLPEIAKLTNLNRLAIHFE